MTEKEQIEIKLPRHKAVTTVKRPRSHKQAAAQVQSHVARAGRSLFKAGCILRDVKEDLGHGHFAAWVEAELGWSPRKAQHLMLIARVFEGKYENFSHLPQATLLAVASSSTSEECRNRIFDKSGRDEKLAPNIIEQELRLDRDRRQESKLAKKVVEPDRSRTELTRTPEERDFEIQKAIHEAREQLLRSGQVRDVPRPKSANRDETFLDFAALSRAAKTIVKRLRQSEVLGFVRDLEGSGHDILADAVNQVVAARAKAQADENQAAWIGRKAESTQSSGVRHPDGH